MKLIAHRGNFEGANPLYENSPEYLLSALKCGYDVEVDVWRIGEEQLWLGHDKPQYQIQYTGFMELLKNPGVWWHAKNYEALVYMLERWPHAKIFAHEIDTYGIVNGGYIWTARTIFSVVSNKTVVMISEPNPFVIQRLLEEKNIMGICCDDLRGIK